MEEKLVTIIVLPYSKAQILKVRLEEHNIECDLEDINLMEDAATSVKVKILDKDIRNAIPVLDEFLGKKAEKEKKPKKYDDHVLVPVDFSPVSFKTCKMAFNIAALLNVKLVFIHCYINPVIHSVPYADVYVYDSTLLERMDNVEKKANENFKKFIKKLSSTIGKEKWKSVKTEYIIKPGYADEDILAYAHENNSRVIVMGTGGDSGLVMGSVTADVIYNAQVPVLVIPEESPEKEILDIKKVLYATNFDEKDFSAIDKLIGILRPFEVQVFCVHVEKENSSDWNHARLEGLKNILKGKYEKKDFNCRLLVGENVLETLDKFIKEENIDIISLTTHKRNMISRLFNPSIARKMVFHSNTPLLVFHA
ncbi:Nucleotide-binding universal stress protein, UspA family [Mariniphaga anaerophila]|uniref:Nucleotide-binding universal stress protein, UspA family n=1 Tax=Mariniphaga anaerophila TaxID=1484053 RepID=A0A1M4YZA0_9BACT|nr:universal stress protein [Mariniphaga anaerophila]SHF10832.1 Nucleotide-binding universal stress protein, UspA family [Mariniphaga anaerophila]